jgi:large subunit ribosomal protein L6
MLVEKYYLVFGKEYMSRIGRKPITLPAGVTIEMQGQEVVVRGTKGELRQVMPLFTSFEVKEKEIEVARANNTRQARANHGLARSLIANMITGVSAGFTRKLELIGTGYRAAMKGSDLNLTVGFSHPVIFAAVPGIKLSAEGNTTVIVEGIDKHMVGQVAANIRKIRPPEPYKGKGIRYEGEYVRRKQGKTAAK